MLPATTGRNWCVISASAGTGFRALGDGAIQREAGQSFGYSHGRLQQLEELQAKCYLSKRSGNAINSCVASSNHDDVLVLGEELQMINIVSRLLFLPGLQEAHCIVYSFQIATLKFQSTSWPLDLPLVLSLSREQIFLQCYELRHAQFATLRLGNQKSVLTGDWQVPRPGGSQTQTHSVVLLNQILG